MNENSDILSKDAIRKYPYTFDKCLTGGAELELCDNIGGGGFSKTYSGKFYDRIVSNCSTDERPYTEVIIKEFFIEKFSQRNEDGVTVEPVGDRRIFDKYLVKFRNESTELKRLNHPSIVKICSKFDANNTAYYVMERITGVTLREFLQNKGCLTLEEAYKVLKTTCSALKFVHANKVLHLDIKPDNIMITLLNDGVYHTTLIDFGLCKTLDEESDYVVLSSSTTAGTIGYSPRELTISFNRRNSLAIDASTDVYSLGATLYFLLTGIDPEQWGELSTCGLVYPRYADPRGKEILEKAMQIHQEHRIKNIQEFEGLFIKALQKQLPNGFKPAPIPTSRDKALECVDYIRLVPKDLDPIAKPIVYKRDSEDTILMVVEPLNDRKENGVIPSRGENNSQDPVFNGIEPVQEQIPSESGNSGQIPVFSGVEPAQEQAPLVKEETKKEDKPTVAPELYNAALARNLWLLRNNLITKKLEPVVPKPESNDTPKDEWKTYVRYVLIAIAAFGILFGVKYWNDTYNSDDNRKDVMKEVSTGTAKDEPKKAVLSPEQELAKLFEDFYEGNCDENEITRLFTDRAYFKMTNGSILIGTPDDPNHTLQKLINSDYLRSGEYRISKVTKDPDSGLIHSVTIQK